jgi:hypothetical protein
MERLDLLTLARIANDTYNEPGQACSGVLAGRWFVEDFVGDDNFLARAYRAKTGNLLVISYRGSVPQMRQWKDWVVADAGAIVLSLNVLALKINTAIDFTSKMSTLFPNCWLVGHSLGGAYVQLLAAICELSGTTINAPGALNLINQMSPNVGIRLVGAIGGGAMSLMTHGVSDYFEKAVASLETAGFASVLNFRGHLDPVSVIGAHVGAPMRTIHCNNPWPNPHSLEPIISTLGKGSPA